MIENIFSLQVVQTPAMLNAAFELLKNLVGAAINLEKAGDKLSSQFYFSIELCSQICVSVINQNTGKDLKDSNASATTEMLLTHSFSFVQ